jgi:hypothetical protein
MPGPSFSTPRSVKPSVPKKRFTLIQANKTLPLVKRIVSDVVRTHDEALKLQAKLELVEDSKQTAAVQGELSRTLEHLQAFVAELTEIGCEIKDYKSGLIDFVGKHQDREVCLCWRLGEDKIHFWHEMTAGFAGRKPIATLIERA